MFEFDRYVYIKRYYKETIQRLYVALTHSHRSDRLKLTLNNNNNNINNNDNDNG